MEPIVERLEWLTSVTRLASGNESRQARRRVPRRWLTYKVGNARQNDALVADWLVDPEPTAAGGAPLPIAEIRSPSTAIQPLKPGAPVPS